MDSQQPVPATPMSSMMSMDSHTPLRTPLRTPLPHLPPSSLPPSSLPPSSHMDNNNMGVVHDNDVSMSTPVSAPPHMSHAQAQAHAQAATFGGAPLAMPPVAPPGGPFATPVQAQHRPPEYTANTNANVNSGGGSLKRSADDFMCVGCGESTEEVCACCLSPLAKSAARAQHDDTSMDEGNALADTTNRPSRGTIVTLECGHRFHSKCLQSCRAHAHSACPLCRAPLPAGLTPELVRAARAAQAASFATTPETAGRIVGAAARARLAVQRAADARNGGNNIDRWRTEVAPHGATLPVSLQEAIASWSEILSGAPARVVDAATAAVTPTPAPAPAGAPQCYHCGLPNVRTCVGCSEVFCTLCSVTDFAHREERAHCLDCHQRERRRLSTTTTLIQ